MNLFVFNNSNYITKYNFMHFCKFQIEKNLNFFLTSIKITLRLLFFFDKKKIKKYLF